MNEIIAVWGKNGSGKSTVAAYLACCLASRGHKTVVIGANRQYGAIQSLFGTGIDQDRSLRHILAGEDSPLMAHCFVECQHVKGVFIASLADDDDCAGARKQRPETVKRFLAIARKSFDYAIVDCEDSTEDALSMLSLTEASRVVFVSTLDVRGATFARACESLVAGLRIADKTEIVLNACNANAKAETSSYALFGIARPHIRLPWCKEVERASGSGKPLTFFGGFGGSAARFRDGISSLASALTDGACSGKKGRLRRNRVLIPRESAAESRAKAERLGQSRTGEDHERIA